MKVKLVVVVVMCLALCACARSTTQPETTVVVYTGTLLAAATELQKGITASTDAGVLPVSAAQTMTGYVQKIHDKGGPLLAAMKVYHAASDLAQRKVTAADAQGIIVEINTAITALLGVTIPSGAMNEITKLIGNVMQAVGVVQAEVAKGLGGA